MVGNHRWTVPSAMSYHIIFIQYHNIYSYIIYSCKMFLFIIGTFIHNIDKL